MSELLLLRFVEPTMANQPAPASTSNLLPPCYGRNIAELRQAAQELLNRAAKVRDPKTEEQANRLAAMCRSMRADGAPCSRQPCMWPRCAELAERHRDELTDRVRHISESL